MINTLDQRHEEREKNKKKEIKAIERSADTNF